MTAFRTSGLFLSAMFLPTALVAAPTRGPSLPEADSFLRRVYAPYLASEDGGDWFHRRAPNVFAPALLKQIRADQKATAGEVDSIGADPFCNCQDGGPLKRLSVAVHLDSPGHATGTVRFVNMTTPERITFKLVAVGPNWRIADIGSKDVPSLVKLLKDAAADYRGPLRPSPPASR